MNGASALATTADRVDDPGITSLADVTAPPEAVLSEVGRILGSLRGRTEVATADKATPSPTGQTAEFPKTTQQSAVRPIAEWQGYVTKIEPDRFHAAMDGVLGSSIVGKRHDAIIPRNEVSPEDEPLLREGAYFRLSVVYRITRGGTGTSKRQSSIVFRRLPAYRKSEIESARDLAKELIRGLRLE